MSAFSENIELIACTETSLFDQTNPYAPKGSLCNMLCRLALLGVPTCVVVANAATRDTQTPLADLINLDKGRCGTPQELVVNSYSWEDAVTMYALEEFGVSSEGIALLGTFDDLTQVASPSDYYATIALVAPDLGFDLQLLHPFDSFVSDLSEVPQALIDLRDLQESPTGRYRRR